MGLLDELGTSPLFQMGMGILASSQGPRGEVSTGQALGRGAMSGMQNVQAAKKAQFMQQARQEQIDQMKRKAKQDALRQQQLDAYRGTLPPQDQPLFDIAHDAYIKNLPQFQKPQLVEVADPNEPLRTVKQWMRPGDAQGTVAGYGTMPEILDPRIKGAKIDIARAGATNIAPKIEVKTGESIASQIGPMLKESRAGAMSGLKLVDSAGRILDAAEKGNLFAGPGANMMLKGAQLADAFGFGGKNNAEKIANTRSVVRGMAEQSVAARSQLGGQAQISNSEQELLNKATAGDIGELTAGEIVQIAQLNDRLGRQLYGLHSSQMENIGSDQNLAGMAKFYAVPKMAPERKPKSNAGSNVKFLGFE